MRTFAHTLLIAGALSSIPVVARAVDCSTLPNPIYLQVGDTQEPLVKKLGRALANSSVKPLTLVYVTSGSCTNISDMYAGHSITVNPKYVPSSAQDAAWTPSSASPTCVAEVNGHPIDIANSALFVSACDPNPPPTGIALFQGPVQAYTFVVPEASSQIAITAEEAYFVFGFGAEGLVTPWNDESFLFIRPVTKSTLLALAANIGVPGAKWHGTALEKSSEVLNAVATSSSPEVTLGILGAEIYDGNRATINALAFKGYGQKYAFFPDSTRTALDKQNVRDGHYLPWSPTVWITHVGSDGHPDDADRAYVVGLILGETVSPEPDFNALDLVIGTGLVPECAMSVTRGYEGGPLSSYAPSEPCGCYYASKVATAPASCVECSDVAPCQSGVCRHGFCEAR